MPGATALRPADAGGEPLRRGPRRDRRRVMHQACGAHGVAARKSVR
ncbi:hypothetical protein C884_02070 [Kocuria palustris PEL]|uniref:Uncharacterized protein n=1 Tax=Kocuria palustris PEL TaxID=1236550 RepID=M2XDI2_9MICC|nr:hypothetical protein C884_02070 [Kocuria palustris PEL]